MILNNNFIINYKNKTTLLYLYKNNIYIKNLNIHQILFKNVSNFSLKYKKNYIYIFCSFLDDSLKLYILNIDNFEIVSKVDIPLDYPYKIYLDYLNIELLTNDTFISFRVFDFSSNTSTICYSYLSLNFIPKTLCKTHCSLYIKPYDICYNEEKIYLISLIESYNSNLVMYLINKTEVYTVFKKYISNLYAFYLTNKDDELFLLIQYCKDKNIDLKLQIFKNDKLILINNNFKSYYINKPLISFYNDKLYIYWLKNNKVNTLYSKNLIEWKYNFFENKYKEYTLVPYCLYSIKNNTTILNLFYNNNLFNYSNKAPLKSINCINSNATINHNNLKSFNTKNITNSIDPYKKFNIIIKNFSYQQLNISSTQLNNFNNLKFQFNKLKLKKNNKLNDKDKIIKSLVEFITEILEDTGTSIKATESLIISLNSTIENLLELIDKKNSIIKKIANNKK